MDFTPMEIYHIYLGSRYKCIENISSYATVQANMLAYSMVKFSVCKRQYVDVAPNETNRIITGCVTLTSIDKI